MAAGDRKAPKAAKADGETGVLAKIAQMPPPYRAIGERLNAIIVRSAPQLAPRVRYGMPWYMKDGESWCYFRAAPKFGFITFGFDDPGILGQDDGASDQLVASAYRIAGFDEATEARLAAIVSKAMR